MNPNFTNGRASLERFRKISLNCSTFENGVEIQHTKSEESSIKTWTDLFLDDFCIHSGISINSKCRKYLMDHGKGIFWRYLFDFFACHFIFGPSTLLFWRGTWDYAWVFVQEGYMKVKEQCQTSNNQ